MLLKSYLKYEIYQRIDFDDDSQYVYINYYY